VEQINMAATESDSTTQPKTPRARKPASTSRPAASAAETAQPQAQTTVQQVQHVAERVILVPVGAGLVVRDDIRGLVTRYGTRAGLEREIKRYEKRGNTARTRAERRLRQRRTRIERAVKQNRRRVEREVGTVRQDFAKRSDLVSSQVEKLVSTAQELIGSIS
jgi:hypothetical protein